MHHQKSGRTPGPPVPGPVPPTCTSHTHTESLSPAPFSTPRAAPLLQCAVFPLQLLGFDVDPVNSVQFSNHTGYPSWNGEIMDGAMLWRLVEGLEANQLIRYTHLLTGGVAASCGSWRAG